MPTTSMTRPNVFGTWERYDAMKDTMCEVSAELARARAKFPRPKDASHEAFAILNEEVDELWDEVKGNHPDRKSRMRAEAVQVAAMAIRFIEDVCDQ